MLFNSFTFLVFFPIVIAIYFSIKHKHRWWFLLLASYYFYMCWKPEYVLLIMVSTIVDYVVGLKMADLPTKKKRKPFLIISLLVNLGLLFSFKYLNFFGDSINAIFDSVNIMANVPSFDLLLPVGISFYTFQTLSYTIDVYKGEIKPEKHLGRFALFVSFFPQLVAGPIERASRLLPQMSKKMSFKYADVAYGLKLMTWGFFKKLVIADNLAMIVNQVYNSPDTHSGIFVFIATIFFAFQIYCDFSGYSDIAIGSARVMGFKLMKNFDRPYISQSVSEFWRRWHISLSTWFKDYVYIPLGGNRTLKWRWYYNLFITFLVSGLWHGANWTFVIWGALHGLYIVLENMFNLKTGKLRITGWKGWLRNAIVFGLVLLAWMFFRANNIGDVWTLLSNGFSDLSPSSIIEFFQKSPEARLKRMFLGFGLITFMLILEYLQGNYNLVAKLKEMPLAVRLFCYALAVMSIITLGAFFGSQSFIYFQF